MKFTVSELGEHLPMSTRRIVGFAGRYAQTETAIGHVEGMADGKVVIRDFDRGSHYELTVAEARVLAQAINLAYLAVEQWQKKARGYYTIRAYVADSTFFVTSRERTRPMRESKLRRARRCHVCDKPSMTMFIAADDLRDGGLRIKHAEVCSTCIVELVNRREEIAEVTTMRKSSP